MAPMGLSRLSSSQSPKEPNASKQGCCCVLIMFLHKHILS